MDEWLTFGVALMLWVTSTVDLAILWVLMVQLSAVPADGIGMAAGVLVAFGFFRRLVSAGSREGRS